MWLLFGMYGLLLIGMVYVIRRETWTLPVRSIIGVILMILFILIAYLDKSQIFLDNQPFYNQNPYRNLIFYALMLFGMFSAYLRKSIEERRIKVSMLEEEKKREQKKQKKDGEKDRVTSTEESLKKPSIEFDRWEIIYPLLFSIPTFGALYELIKPANGDYLTVANVVISFQTGFFWQTLHSMKTGQQSKKK